jgi:hypothetical protein
MPEASSVLTPWSSFYAMTGSSAAALTGLMFVVLTLVVGEERRQSTPDGISTFSTPTVMHFAAALLASTILIAPWRSLPLPATLLAIAGFLGCAYLLRVMVLTKRLDIYTPDVEDWAWFSILPFGAYGAILGGAIALPISPVNALFVVAAGVVALIFIGIRNSWDVVTYLAVGNRSEPPKPS